MSAQLFNVLTIGANRLFIYSAAVIFATAS
jgi:hypothetical protein